MRSWDPRYLRPINSHEELDKIEESLTWAVRLWHPSITLFKLPGWVAVPSIRKNLDTPICQERLLQAIASRGYSQLYAIRIGGYGGFLGYEVSLTLEGIEYFRHELKWSDLGFQNFALFSGMPEPEFVILSLNKLDLEDVGCDVIVGQADFVLEVLGCEVSDTQCGVALAFSRFQNAIIEIGPLQGEREYLMRIYDCLKDCYEQADECTEFGIIGSPGFWTIGKTYK